MILNKMKNKLKLNLSYVKVNVKSFRGKFDKNVRKFYFNKNQLGSKIDKDQFPRKIEKKTIFT